MAVTVAAKTRENTASVTRKHKFFCGHRRALIITEFILDNTLSFEEKRKVDTRVNMRETTRDCRRLE